MTMRRRPRGRPPRGQLERRYRVESQFIATRSTNSLPRLTHAWLQLMAVSPRFAPRTVFSGTDALSLFMGNCARQVGARHRLGLLLRTSDAELYSACRTRDRKSTRLNSSHLG